MAGSCVRVDPKFIEFKNVSVGRVYRRAVRVTNVGKTLKKIIIEKPTLKLFSFIPSSQVTSVPSGLSVSGLLEFAPEAEEEVRDCVRIRVDDVEAIQIPVLGSPRVCSLATDSSLDFGRVVASSQVITKLHPITNQGSAPGAFQVEHSGGDSSLSLSPPSGVVAAGATQWLKAELRTDRPRQIDEEALVRLQNRSAVVLSIRAQVVEHHLEAVDLQGTPLTSLWFGPVYFGTSRVEKVILRNSTPRACDWVCLLRDNTSGTEVGTDVRKSTDVALLEGRRKSHDVPQVLACVPSQGRLVPRDQTIVTVCFSPISRRRKGDSSAKRQDYSFSLLFDAVGRKHGFTHYDANSIVEVSVTGSGLPVSLAPAPSHRFDFLGCAIAHSSARLCVLQNLCPQLPVSFRFRKTAHFNAKPPAATIGPGQCQDVVLTFSAQQQGSFRVRQKVDVFGCVASRRDAAELEVSCFHTITLRLSATCHNVATQPPPELNPAGLKSPAHVQSSEVARAALLSADKTQLRKCHADDRAFSVRPGSADKQHRTVFTGYAFTEEEEDQRRRHRRVYRDFIEQLRQARLEKIKSRQREKPEDSVDIGIVPAQGLVPPTLRMTDLERSESSERDFKYGTSPQDTTSITSQVSEGTSAVPSVGQEVADCSRTLTPLELYQITISPSFVDFGRVCARSACVQTLRLANPLAASVWVQLEVDCPELRGSSPLSHVLPPRSHTSLPLTFESSTLGPFYGSLSYLVNQQHPGQIVVQAQVIPLSLELSTELLVLQPTPTATLAAPGHRSSVTLRNHCNRAAEFTWQPSVPESDIPFSVQPASGTVEPFMELDCEVVWYPSFSSPSEGYFDLCVHEGDTQRLHCVAKVGAAAVQLAEKRIVFESVPLGITSTRTAVLHNSGPNHAFYQVVDVRPVPGMVVSPREGAVPSRGRATLNIRFHPDSVIRFDASVQIRLRGAKSVDLRVAGSVEPPNVDISVSHFQFCGVHSGSRQAAPFTVTNRSPATARVTFDLSEYEDFSIQLPQPFSDGESESASSVLELQDGQTKECFLIFSPTQVVSHDFHLPLTVNGVKWPAASSSTLPSLSSTSPSLTADSRSRIRAFPDSVAMRTQQPPRIQATALCALLDMSPSGLQFIVEPQSDPCSKNVELKAAREGSVCWRAVTGGRAHWWFDSSAASVSAEGTSGRQLCVVSPSSGGLSPGQSVCLVVTVNPKVIRTGEKVTKLTLPLYLGVKPKDGAQRNEKHRPYRELSVIVTLEIPSVTFQPRQLLLTPAPLTRTTETTLILQAAGYPSGTRISAEVDEVDLEDGTKIQPLSVIFPEGNTIHPQEYDQQQEAKATSLLCKVSFCSAVPLSLRTAVVFTDHMHNRFEIELCAVADCCLLTVWPYMALRHHSDQQVVLKTGATAVEAILQSCHIPNTASATTKSSSSSTTSSLFDHSSSVYKDSDSSSYSGSMSEEYSVDTYASANRDTSTSLGIPEFTAANIEAGQYHQAVLLAVETWFSLFGWPNGPHPITIPHTLRRAVSATQTSKVKRRSCGVSLNKDTRSVVEMLHHLTGRQIPGIPLCQTLSSDINQRVHQLIEQYGAMLAFLRVQGASLCHIRPEYLLDVLEFQHWCSQQLKDTNYGVDFSSVDYESLSKRSWTDVLLQIYKVLVLCRVSERGPNPPVSHTDTDGIQLDGSQSLVSNIYSSSELQLLSWLNMNFQKMRKTVWDAGRRPSARWIVNFDLDLTDGLVLAALVAAYCPYLIRSHFRRMYTSVSSPEQILHNNIIMAQALSTLGLNIDIQSTDLFNSNPVQMLFLCVHLYEMLPHCVPLHTVILSGGLHSTFSKQVRLKNPTLKPFKYQAFLLGEEAHFFSLPDGPLVTVPPKSSATLNVQFDCLFLQSREAVLLLRSVFGHRCATVTFSLKTHVSHVAPTNAVQCSSSCYQLKVIQVPLINIFSKEANFRVVLVESDFNPLEPETRKDSDVQHEVSFNTNKKTMNLDMSDDRRTEDGDDERFLEDEEFLSTRKSVSLKSGQADTLSILYLPFFPGTKYCSVLLSSPQVGDMVYVVKATSELPLPSPLSAKPSYNSVSVTENSDTGVSASAPRLHCEVGEVREEVLRVPRVNPLWENALAVWAQQFMSAGEHRRRRPTNTPTAATRRFMRQQSCLAKLMRSVYQSKGVEYGVEASLPQYFTLPTAVIIPVEQGTDAAGENPADRGCVDVPLRLRADSAGQFTCKVVLRSCCDTRVYLLEALVTSQVSETQQDQSVQAVACGEGFSGPGELNVPAGTRETYPLTFDPASQRSVTGKLSVRHDHDGTEHVFTLRGEREPPLLVEHVVLPCSVGRTTYTQLDVPNDSQRELTLEVETDLSVVSGSSSLEVKPGSNCLYTLAVLPWKRGKHTGHVSFVETGDLQGEVKDEGSGFRRCVVRFSLELICEPAAPVEVIDVRCVCQSSVTIEIPVRNPGEERLMLDAFLEGGDLTGAKSVSVSPREAVSYKATFSPVRAGKITGSVVFQSEQVGEFWYQLELYALPPPISRLPQARCQLGKWIRLEIPLVNPTAESLELIVTNANPKHYTLEMDSAETLTMAPRSFTHLGVRFSPSAIGVDSHQGKITFMCSQLQEWCVLLSGCGLQPEAEELLCVSSVIGSSSSIAIPFTNPTELPATLSVTLTDDDPGGAPTCRPITDEKAFSCPLSHTEGLHISERATVEVPVVFAPNSVELQQAWLCITLKPISSQSNNTKSRPDFTRSEEEHPNICWTYPLCGIPTEDPAESAPLDVVQCEVGRQLERTLDVRLTGYTPANGDQREHGVIMEDFWCEVQSERSELKDRITATIEAARRDPKDGVATLTLHLAYAPIRTCRCSSVLKVQAVSGKTWEFPIIFIATKPEVDDVILIETTELGKTSAVGFRLTSTTRRSKPFTAAFLPGSSPEFTITPSAGVLPPAGTAGALITVSFTPDTSGRRRRARLVVQAGDVEWTYEVRGEAPQDSPRHSSARDKSLALIPS